jgi:hypothetical protein
MPPPFQSHIVLASGDTADSWAAFVEILPLRALRTSAEDAENVFNACSTLFDIN